MFALFGYNNVYPNGGWNDLMATFETEAEAASYLMSLDCTINKEEFHVVDLVTKKKVLVASWEQVGEVRKRNAKLLMVKCS